MQKNNIKTDFKMGWYGMDRSVWVYGPVAGSCEHDNEPSGSMKRWEIAEQLNNR
jgi:hypothetical protein